MKKRETFLDIAKPSILKWFRDKEDFSEEHIYSKDQIIWYELPPQSGEKIYSKDKMIRYDRSIPDQFKHIHHLLAFSLKDIFGDKKDYDDYFDNHYYVANPKYCEGYKSAFEESFLVYIKNKIINTTGMYLLSSSDYRTLCGDTLENLTLKDIVRAYIIERHKALLQVSKSIEKSNSKRNLYLYKSRVKWLLWNKESRLVQEIFKEIYVDLERINQNLIIYQLLPPSKKEEE